MAYNVKYFGKALIGTKGVKSTIGMWCLPLTVLYGACFFYYPDFGTAFVVAVVLTTPIIFIVTLIVVIQFFRSRMIFRALFTVCIAIVLEGGLLFLFIAVSFGSMEGTHNLSPERTASLGRETYKYITKQDLPKSAIVLYSRMYGFPDTVRVVIFKTVEASKLFQALPIKGKFSDRETFNKGWWCNDPTNKDDNYPAAIRKFCSSAKDGTHINSWSYSSKSGTAEAYAVGDYILMKDSEF